MLGQKLEKLFIVGARTDGDAETLVAVSFHASVPAHDTSVGHALVELLGLGDDKEDKVGV